MNDEKFLKDFDKNGKIIPPSIFPKMPNMPAGAVKIPIPEELFHLITEMSRPQISSGYNVCHLTLMGVTTCLSVIKKYFEIIYESSNEGNYIVKIPQQIPLDLVRALRGVGKVVLLFEEDR